MTRAALPLLLTLPLAACGGSGTSFSFDGNSLDGNTSIEADGNGQITISGGNFHGAISLPKIEMSADDFDIDGVKLYPGSKLGDFHVEAQDRQGTDDDKGKVDVSFESPAAAETVRAWFRDKMTAKGFKVQDAGNGLKGTTEDGKAFTLSLSGDGDKSSGRIEVGN